MSLYDIKKLPVSELADENCALFMWTTIPFLKQSFDVMEAWGFQYKTVAFVWIKKNRKADSLFWGTGYWTRANSEICMLATRGHPKRQSASVHQVIISHIEEHSKKPEEARERIVELMGDVRRIELFARRKSPGWDCGISLTENVCSMYPESRMPSGNCFLSSHCCGTCEDFNSGHTVLLG